MSVSQVASAGRLRFGRRPRPRQSGRETTGTAAGICSDGDRRGGCGGLGFLVEERRGLFPRGSRKHRNWRPPPSVDRLSVLTGGIVSGASAWKRPQRQDEMTPWKCREPCCPVSSGVGWSWVQAPCSLLLADCRQGVLLVSEGDRVSMA